MLTTEQINIRDPFVLTAEGRYYLYGTRGETCWGEADGFDVYTGTDLEHWDGPFECFHNDGSFWADRDYWAPEVHPWRGAYYMLASFRSLTHTRGTCVLRAETPMGPFVPWSDGPVTPADWVCLDGTLHVEADGTPYMVFCHEWVQVGDGEVCAMPLTPDLRAAAGEPRVLFHASDAKWCQRKHHSSGIDGYVTDGPFLWRTRAGELLCLWASFSESGYTEALAISDDGTIHGRFTQIEPLFWQDGGHGMVFRGLDGQLLLTLHTPNIHLKEHPAFYPLEDIGTRLVTGDRLPSWYAPLRTELEHMAEDLTRSLRPWHGPDRVIAPGEPDADGKSTAAIQRAIDEAHRLGGGTVLLSGERVSGSLVLRSGVRLYLAEGARLLASTDLADFPEHHAARLTVQDTSMGMHQSLIFAEGCHDIAIMGEGTIDGRGAPANFPGDETAQGTPGRPFVIRMIDCRDITLSGVTLRNSPCWMQNYLNCERLLVDGITVRNHSNYNNDGIDIDSCRDVIVRRCSIHSGDDACCFKGAGMRDDDRILVEDCELFSACNAVKIGTDTQGSFRRVLVRNCRIGGLKEDPSGLKHPYCDSAVSLEMLDGGTVEDVLVTDCEVERAWSPVFMRLEDRGRVRPGDPRPRPGRLRRCAVTRLRGTDCGPRGSYLFSVPEEPLEDILLMDLRFSQAASTRPVLDESAIGDLRGVYPDAHMIDGLGDAPAYALWARHVHRLTLAGVKVTPEGEDPRPEYVLGTDVTVDEIG